MLCYALAGSSSQFLPDVESTTGRRNCRFVRAAATQPTTGGREIPTHSSEADASEAKADLTDEAGVHAEIGAAFEVDAPGEDPAALQEPIKATCVHAEAN